MSEPDKLPRPAFGCAESTIVAFNIAQSLAQIMREGIGISGMQASGVWFIFRRALVVLGLQGNGLKSDGLCFRKLISDTQIQFATGTDLPKASCGVGFRSFESTLMPLQARALPSEKAFEARNLQSSCML